MGALYTEILEVNLILMASLDMSCLSLNKVTNCLQVGLIIGWAIKDVQIQNLVDLDL